MENEEIKNGWRFVFNQDGRILYSEGESSGDVVPRKPFTFVDFVEFEYGEIDLSTQDVVSVDPITKEPIFKERPLSEAQLEQKRIQELEDTILMQAENEIGGIL